ncbi:MULTISPECIES: DUF4153 domain-containing protein [unclassified Halomonas]|uniref:DUF4153 domain-containing protein n=1 Tax=unclassified Halomonas TaxID=2609666 RepID=UPI00209FD71B|nr:MULTISPECIES: DUF4153 domain-containing protein [unclassified Halomonas]MCP1313898.1 DUF4153 domain-containing protein [Halomonas sp. 707D7]MCP1325563.1 DUF4153 domain-containing protein [Halomonas sp. 707D4]
MNACVRVALDNTTRLALISMAVFQGCALLALHLALEHSLMTDARWLKALYSVTLGLPAFYLLGMVRLRDRLNAAALLLAPLLFALGWHLGGVAQAPGTDEWGWQAFGFTYAVTTGTALFILAVFFRSAATCRHFPRTYPPLLSISWEFALTLGLLALFIVLFWGLLWLAAALFAAIGIATFETLFDEPVFVYPVTWLVLGLALVTVRARFGLIHSVRQMLEVLTRALLPLVTLIFVLFLAVLPVTGLQPIWETGRASSILMALMFTLLLFFNIVFHDANGAPPYHTLLRRAVWLGIVLLPAGSLLAGWALWQRIDQYGASLDRLWAVVLQILLATFTLTYTVMVVWHRRRALVYVQRANMVLAAWVASVLILINTPLADLRQWTAQHQVQRLVEGRTSEEAFDVDYLRFALGQPGVDALKEIQQSDFMTTRPALARRIERSLEKSARWSEPPSVDARDPDAVAGQFEAVNGDALPASLLRSLATQMPQCLSQELPCRVLRMAPELRFEWLVSPAHEASQAFAPHADTWQTLGQLVPLGGVIPEDDSICQTSAPPNHIEPLSGSVDMYRSERCLYSLQPTLESVRRALDQGSNASGAAVGATPDELAPSGADRSGRSPSP